MYIIWPPKPGILYLQFPACDIENDRREILGYFNYQHKTTTCVFVAGCIVNLYYFYLFAILFLFCKWCIYYVKSKCLQFQMKNCMEWRNYMFVVIYIQYKYFMLQNIWNTSLLQAKFFNQKKIIFCLQCLVQISETKKKINLKWKREKKGQEIFFFSKFFFYFIK